MVDKLKLSWGPQLASGRRGYGCWTLEEESPGAWCEEDPSDRGTVTNQVGLQGAVCILTGEVAGKDGERAGGETGDSFGVSERSMGIVGLPRVLAGVRGWESLERGRGMGSGEAVWNLGKGQETWGRCARCVYKMSLFEGGITQTIQR